MNKVIFLLVTGLLMLVLASCTPNKAKIYGIGDTYINHENGGRIELKSAEITDKSAPVHSHYLSLEVLFDYDEPETINQENVYFEYGDKKVFTQELMQNELNGYDIFQTPIRAETVKFIFLISDDQLKKDVNESLLIHINHAPFTIYLSDFDSLK